MNATARRIALTALGLALLSPQALAKDQLKITGLWKLHSFQVEDVATKAVSNVYGKDARGHMTLTNDGNFHAYVFSSSLGPEPGLYDDVACSLPQCAFSRSGIIYAGTYRLDGSKFIINVTHARYEGPVGVQPFDLTWTEGRTRSEEVRYYRLETSATEGAILQIETSPMANPNGAGNQIIGRVVWERE